MTQLDLNKQIFFIEQALAVLFSLGCVTHFKAYTTINYLYPLVLMTIDDIHNYALSFPDTEVGLPFGPDVLVFKAKSKMFLLVPINIHPIQFNVKCNPENAIILREQYPNVIIPGYHMSKKHWNTIIVQGSLSSNQLKQFIQASYNLIVKK